MNTNPKYWDCECEANYIHAKAETLSCPICKAIEENSPDSMINEVKAMLKRQASQKIHDYEYFHNRLQHLNNSGVTVKNLRKVANGYKADIIIFIDEVKERYNDCFYPMSLFEDSKNGR